MRKLARKTGLAHARQVGCSHFGADAFATGFSKIAP
jgi:hypothetical protein